MPLPDELKRMNASLRDENARLRRELYDTQVRCTAAELDLALHEIDPGLVISNFDLSEDDNRYFAVQLFNEASDVQS